MNIEFLHLFCQKLLRPAHVIFLKTGWWNTNCNPPEATRHQDLIKLLILLPPRTIYFRTFQCEIPCTIYILFSLSIVFTALSVFLIFNSLKRWFSLLTCFVKNNEILKKTTLEWHSDKLDLLEDDIAWLIISLLCLSLSY